VKKHRSTALLETVLAAAMVVAGLSLVVVPLLGPGGLGLEGSLLRPFGPPLSVPAQLLESEREILPAGDYAAGDAVELSGPTIATASVVDPDLPQRIGLVGGSVLLGLTVLGVLALLLQVTRTLRHGDAFVPANARRLSRIAVLVGVGVTSAQLLRQFGAVAVLEAPSVRERVVPVFEVSFLPFVAALGIGVLAEVFRQGAAMREDVEGLV